MNEKLLPDDKRKPEILDAQNLPKQLTQQQELDVPSLVEQHFFETIKKLEKLPST